MRVAGVPSDSLSCASSSTAGSGHTGQRTEGAIIARSETRSGSKVKNLFGDNGHLSQKQWLASNFNRLLCYNLCTNC